jgi:hypothetical protein
MKWVKNMLKNRYIKPSSDEEKTSGPANYVGMSKEDINEFRHSIP